MVDLPSISTAISSLKLAGDIAKTMIGLRDAKAFNSKMIEFQSAIIDAQTSALAANEERAALVQRIDALETEMASLKAWEAEKERYELKPFGQRSTFAYMVKPQRQNGEPAHWICPACYQHGKKSILQLRGLYTGYNAHECPDCKAMIFEWE